MLGRRALLATCVALASAKEPSTECVFNADGVTFDVSALKMGMSASYHVKDMRDTIENNYTYVFNVCGYADSPDTDCDVTNAGTGPAPAFQVYDNGQGCHRLGRIGSEFYQWKLLDNDDPTVGASLTYTNGDECDAGKKQRSMTIQFVCAESWGNTPNSRVIEDECHYQVEFQTAFGCPQECPFADRKMCGGHGFCGMDSDKNTPRCFCNDQWAGNNCMTPSSELDTGGCNGTCVALVFVMLLLISLLAAGGIIYYRVTKLASLNLKFGALSDTFNPEEGVGLTQNSDR